MIRKVLTLLSVFILISSATFAKSWAEQKGDAEFDNFSFLKAIDFYSTAFKKKKEIKEDEKEDYARVAGKIGDCNRLIHNYTEAEVWYKKALDLGNAEKETRFFYAQALRSNGKYEQSETAFEEYLRLVPEDVTAREIYEQFDLVTNLQEDKGFYSVRFENEVNSNASEYSPAFFNDQIIFVSNKQKKALSKFGDVWTNKDQFYQLFISDVEQLDKSLQKDKLFSSSDILGRYHEGPLSLDKSKNTLYFTRSNYVKKKPTKDSLEIVHLKIYSTRLSRSGDGSGDIREAFRYNSDNYSVGHPTISEDGNMIVFMSDMPGGYGESDLYMCTRSEEAGWGTPVNLGNVINSKRREMFPFLDAKGNLYFSSEGHPGLGGLDLYKCINHNGKWGEPENLGSPMNGPRDDFGLVADKDGKYGYFSSNRKDKFNNDDIYSFQWVKPTECYIAGTARDQKTGNILPGSDIVLFDSAGAELEVITADVGGHYSFTVKPGRRYALAGKAFEYADGKNSVKINELCEIEKIDLEAKEVPDSVIASLGTDLLVDLDLNKDLGIILEGLVVEEGTQEVIPKVKIIIADENTGEDLMVLNTSNEGDFRKVMKEKKIGDEFDYDISLYKKGYLPKRFMYDEYIAKAGTYKFKEELTKLEVGMDLNEIIEINPIYFDLDKYFIRPDAAAELDKIIDLMNEYPEMVIELGSHTDCRASHAYNEILSSNRAKSSRKYIIEKGGIDSKRIYGKGYGENQLTNVCKDGVNCSEAQHQMNRRTEFRIVKL